MSRDGENNGSELSRVDRLEIELNQVATSVEDVKTLVEASLSDMKDSFRSMISYFESRLPSGIPQSTVISLASAVFGRTKPRSGREHHERRKSTFERSTGAGVSTFAYCGCGENSLTVKNSPLLTSTR
jgi:hypothetical protein